MSNMKDTGITWIGEIPSSWQIKPINECFKIRNVKVSDNDYPPLSVTKTSAGIIPQMDSVAKSDAHDDRKLVLINDFVINSRSDRKMSCGVSRYNGSVSLINHVLEPRGQLLPSFVQYLLKNEGFAEEFYKWGHGIVADLWTTSWSEMKKISLPIPPISIQEKLVKILDSSISKIDELIELQEQQIAKLKEYKFSLITEAVTKGLNPNVPMKNSGVDWIGEIPEDWEVKRFKFVATKLEKGSGISKENIVVDGDVPCVRYGEIYTKYNISFNKCFTRTNLANVSSPQYFSYGDLLFSGTGELVEEIGKSIVYLGNERCLAGGDIIIAKHKQSPSFMGYLMNSLYVQKQKSFGKSKLKVVHISATNIANIMVALPSLLEQEQIAKYLDEKCIQIDKLIAIKQSKIVELQQYKKSLIYEYVTGKREVV